MNTLRGIFSTTALIITVIVLLINSCQRSVPGELQVALADVKQAHAPDKRVAVFNITLSRDGNRVVVSGEVDRREYHAALFEGLKGAAGDLELVDQVTTLPPDSLGDESFGIVSVSVAPMRAAPEVSAEMIDQAMLGTVVRILKKENWYYYVQNWDGYLGWLSPSFFEPIDSAGAEEWETAARVVVTGNYGVVRAAANSGSTILSDLVPGAVL
ncbi:MAG: SH3 domain-containing protein, partial [Candidatus Marinimicrobia bacterium]|nr:SH3 domain-containing protein [Candidatus Neomarinimicrobiota bacterium]